MESLSTVIIIAVISLIASAIFSGLEFAFVSSNKLKVQLRRERGGASGRALGMFFKNPSLFLGTTLTANNIVLVIYTTTMAKLLEPLIHNFTESGFLVLLIQTLISTLFVLLFGEYLPKILFRINPSGILARLATPFSVIYVLLWPFTTFVVWLAKILLKVLFNIEYKTSETVFAKTELQNYLLQHQINKSTSSETSHFSDAEEIVVDQHLIEKALEFTDAQVRDCLIPRTDIEGVEMNEDIQSVKDIFIHTKHSRLVVYEENLDTIKGYYHHRDILDNELKIWDIPVVPESLSAINLLKELRMNDKSIALVVDEYGGTAGIVTLEDIIEEIFGEIHDEHDDDIWEEKIIGKNRYRFSGRLEIDYLNEKYELNIPEGDYETLAGFILTAQEEYIFPKKGTLINIGNYQIKILEADKNIIEMVEFFVEE